MLSAVVTVLKRACASLSALRRVFGAIRAPATATAAADRANDTHTTTCDAETKAKCDAMTASNAKLPISKLPPELLIKIFLEGDHMWPCLDALDVRRVCRAWNNIVEATPVFWQQLLLPGRPPARGIRQNISKPKDYPGQAELFVKRAQGHVKVLFINLGSLEHPDELTGLDAFAAVVPWHTLQEVFISDIVPSSLYEHIRECSSLKCLYMRIGQFKADIETTDAIASAPLQEVVLEFNLVGDGDCMLNIKPAMLRNAKLIRLDLSPLVLIRPHQVQHLDQLIAQVTDQGRYDMLSLSLTYSQTIGPLGMSWFTVEGSIMRRRVCFPADTAGHAQRIASLETVLKHPVAYTFFLQLSIFSAQRVERLQLHGIAPESLTQTSTFPSEWSHVTHIAIEHCNCDRNPSPGIHAANYPAPGLHQAQAILDLLFASRPVSLRTVELIDFPEWTGSGTLDYVKGEVDRVLDEGQR